MTPHGLWIGGQQPANQVMAEGHRRHLREMIEIDVERVGTDPVDDSREIVEQAVVAGIFEVKRRQHERRVNTDVEHFARQRDGLRQGAHAGPDHQAVARQIAVGELVEKIHFLGEREGIALAGGAEQQHPVAAIVQQPAGMIERAGHIDRKIVVESGQAGGHHAGRARRGRHGRPFRQIHCAGNLARKAARDQAPPPANRVRTVDTILSTLSPGPKWVW